MKNLIFLVILCCNGFVFGQNEKIIATKIDSVQFIAQNFIGVDNHGNYFFENENVLYKKTPTSVLQYQNIQLGNIKKVDILNPLKIVVFYEDFNSVVLLDNQLNEMQKINFSEIEIPIIVSAVGISGQNKLWIYNATNQQIGLFDLSLNEITNLNIPVKEKLNSYQTDFNYFYWIDNDNLLQTCTVFGKILPPKPITNTDNLIIIKDNIVLYIKNSSLYLEDFSTKKVYQIVNIENSFKKMFYKEQILTIFTNQGITNYKITLP